MTCHPREVHGVFQVLPQPREAFGTEKRSCRKGPGWQPNPKPKVRICWQKPAEAGRCLLGLLAPGSSSGSAQAWAAASWLAALHLSQFLQHFGRRARLELGWGIRAAMMVSREHSGAALFCKQSLRSWYSLCYFREHAVCVEALSVAVRLPTRWRILLYRPALRTRTQGSYEKHRTRLRYTVYEDQVFRA